MKLQINWGEPVIRREDVLEISIGDLNDFYAAASEVDQLNLFFILLTSLRRYLDLGDRERAAHLSFLAAYYLFTPLTPPGSWELSMHYIRQAVALNPREEYREWVPLMEAGN